MTSGRSWFMCNACTSGAPSTGGIISSAVSHTPSAAQFERSEWPRESYFFQVGFGIQVGAWDSRGPSFWYIPYTVSSWLRRFPVGYIFVLPKGTAIVLSLGQNAFVCIESRSYSKLKCHIICSLSCSEGRTLNASQWDHCWIQEKWRFRTFHFKVARV